PFIINTSSIKTEVLGTSFNVKAYENESNASVTLVSGKVKVKMLNKDLVLWPSFQVTFNNDTKTYSHEKVDLNKVLSWKNNTLIFDNEPLSSIIPQLERWYDVEIRLRNLEMADCRLTGAFKDESLESILKSFTFVIDNMMYKFLSPRIIEVHGQCNNK
ncbi:FecR family protein, partial [Flavobacteriaceae bacterium]|nr:FecR family protein [Flavobacteriaceae bacterium]